MNIRRISVLVVGIAALGAGGLLFSKRGPHGQQDGQSLERDLNRQDDPNRAPLIKAFNGVYASAKWAKGADGQGTSGPGSTLEATAAYRAFIEDFIKTHDVKSVVDAGCGDWAFSSKIDWHGAHYTGIDISTDVIDVVRKKYSNATVQFAVGNVTEPLPPADLLLCKDVLQHLPIALIQRFIDNNLRPGKYKWAIITNDKGPANIDIPAGEYRTINLGQPPFNVKALVDLPFRFPESRDKITQLLDFTRP
jgi:SAM-dependent methyltransferase